VHVSNAVLFIVRFLAGNARTRSWKAGRLRTYRLRSGTLL